MILPAYSNKMKCEYCEIIERESPADLIYEDEEIVIAVKDLAAIPGQITVFPKEHLTIMEMVPDKILEKCAAFANKAGIAIFESLGCQGTNIIVQNGLGAGQKVPHFAIEIVPRREGDGLNLQWEPKQLMEDEMETTVMILKEGLERLEKEPEIKEEKAGKKEERKKIEKKDEKESYLLKSLKKIP